MLNLPAFAQVGCAIYSPSCTNPVPSTSNAGIWQELDDSGNLISTWYVTQSGGDSPGAQGTVFGSVTVPPPASGCPAITYSLSGTINQPDVIDGQNAATSVTWTASGPNPSATCQNYTPVSSRTLNGYLYNKDNDNSQGTLSTSSGGSESISPGSHRFVRANNLFYRPVGETIFGLGPTQASPVGYNFYKDIAQGQDPSLPIVWQGRTVYEYSDPPSGTTPDGCYSQDPLAPGRPFDGVSGSSWNVGYPGNINAGVGGLASYGIDTISFAKAQVDYYQTSSAVSLPCATNFYQKMYILVTQATDPFASYGYSTNAINATIYIDSLSYTIGPVSPDLNDSIYSPKFSDRHCQLPATLRSEKNP